MVQDNADTGGREDGAILELNQDIKTMTKNMSQLDQEQFYDKLMALKKEHERHIKLVEKGYLSEVYQDDKKYDSSSTQGILKVTSH